VNNIIFIYHLNISRKDEQGKALMRLYDPNLIAFLDENSRMTRFAKVDLAIEALKKQLEYEQGASADKESSPRESSKATELSRSQANATAKLNNERAELDADTIELVKNKSKFDISKLKLVAEKKVCFSNRTTFHAIMPYFNIFVSQGI
jgi:hypothetical protein